MPFVVAFDQAAYRKTHDRETHLGQARAHEHVLGRNLLSVLAKPCGAAVANLRVITMEIVGIDEQMSLLTLVLGLVAVTHDVRGELGDQKTRLLENHDTRRRMPDP